MMLISLPGSAKNQEDEISDFKMSHWKQVGFKEHTLKLNQVTLRREEKHDSLLALVNFEFCAGSSIEICVLKQGLWLSRGVSDPG